MQAQAGLLLGSDLTYFPAVFEILASTLRALAGPGTRKSEFLCFVETRQHERKPLGETVLTPGGHYVCCMYVLFVRLYIIYARAFVCRHGVIRRVAGSRRRLAPGLPAMSPVSQF
jgi:hypothetical protein|eukprot:COSAG01_NODE_12130_length_1796_cov_3.955804_2_plen_115_part_00